MLLVNENRENFYAYHLDNLIDIYNNLKERYVLLGFMDNIKVVNFVKIILDNLTFKEVVIDNEDSDNDTSDDDYVEYLK
jgi:hypothetical protein